ncbi:MAG: glycosyltransferase [Clostridia bacterium]|nr:glycosyltransferase [Clostridia bacterium]
MTISIVLCTYNGEKYLRRQLDSLRAQTLPPCETLIADDASADGTTALVSEYIRTHGLGNWTLTANRTNTGYRRNFRDKNKPLLQHFKRFFSRILHQELK